MGSSAGAVGGPDHIVSKLRPHVDRYYRELSNGSLMARIDYRANASQGHFELPTPENLSDAESIAAIEKHEGELADADFAEVRLIAELSERREAEMQRGVNLVGPHRDDLALTLGSLPARGYASHGESWSYALALKLAAWEILRADVSGEWAEDGEPILILDDVFSELDAGRRERLAGIVSRAGQVFVTVAVGSELPEGLNGQRLHVADGKMSLRVEGVADA